MPIVTIGINHKTAPVSVRERVAFAPEQLPDALTSVTALPGIDEAAIISTCNRTELYLSVETLDIQSRVIAWFADFHKLSPSQLQDYIYLHPENETVKHILKVASGIDSMILGEPQILGQLKDAYRHAMQAGTLGTLLGRLLQYSFTVAKQVRTDTAIGASPVSVAFSAVRLAQQIFGALDSYTVLLVGAGETIELAARHLHDKQIGRLIVANRTLERAHDLASELGGYAINLHEISSHLAEADIVISSTAAPDVIIQRPDVEAALKRRKHKPIYMVDLAVPRDIDADIAELEDIYLYTVDDLHQVIEENLNSRKQAAQQAEEIIDIQVSHFLAWKRSLEAVSTIRQLREDAESFKQEVLAKAKAQLAAGKSAEEVLQFLAHTLTNKVIHAPSVALKEAGAHGRYELIKAAQELFDLDIKLPNQPNKD